MKQTQKIKGPTNFRIIVYEMECSMASTRGVQLVDKDIGRKKYKNKFGIQQLISDALITQDFRSELLSCMLI